MTVVMLGAGFDQLKEALGEGADVNALFGERQQTALSLVVQTGWPDKKEYVEILLAAGADPNIGDARGITPLHEVAYKLWDIDAAALLLDHRANINAQSKNGATPLHSALYGCMFSDDLRMINFLLKRGADIAIKNDLGVTPMDFAEKHGCREIVAQFTARENEKRRLEMRKQQEQIQRDITAGNLERLRQKKPVIRLKK